MPENERKDQLAEERERAAKAVKYKPLHQTEFEAMLKRHTEEPYGEEVGRLLATIEVMRHDGAKADKDRQLYWHLLMAMAIVRGGWLDVKSADIAKVPPDGQLQISHVTDEKGLVRALRCDAKRGAGAMGIIMPGALRL